MIKVPSPSMALNSEDVPGASYRLDNTWYVSRTESPQKICGWIAVVAADYKSRLPGSRFTVVFNSHGYEIMNHGGYGLAMGTGIKRSDIPQFDKLRPHVDEIWFIACQAAYIDTPGGAGDGNLLMSGIAKAAQASVKVSTATQVGDLWLPGGYVDDWEGTVLTYGPGGDVIDVAYN
ncbi:hypothetical protein [Massilia aerilata]|uniref:DUF4347 domain-containing protein n=1 Tax=Massilia aerilata TaxID=453817 RepID=A0ABW0RU85_9BURK